jgi:putative transposase
MKRRRHTPEQIIRKLREAERLLGEGKTISEAAKELRARDARPGGVRCRVGGREPAGAHRV